MKALRQQKVVKGYVVKRETIEEIPDPKRAGQCLKRKKRVEISRVYHAISAAQVFMEIAKKSNPDWDLFIHEKSGVDGLSH